MFLADCQKFDSIPVLAKSRGARFSVDDPGAAELLTDWMLQWTVDGRTLHRTVALCVTATRQRFGGVRRWWRCPLCGRRCRLLVAVTPDAPIGCRLCLNTRYSSDYPARDRRRRFVALVHSLGQGSLDADDERELDWLMARRRVGIRRGRRVRLRAARALARFDARCSGINDILNNGGI